MNKDLEKTRETSLSIFLTRYFFELDKRGVKYCVIGNFNKLPYYTDNDVDIWVSDISVAKRMLNYVTRTHDFSTLLWNVTSNGVNCFIEAKDNSIIHIDLLKNVSWRSFVPIISRQKLAQNIDSVNGLKVASHSITTLGHLIYPLLTFGDVKEKYRSNIIVSCKSSQYFNDLISDLVGVKLGKKIVKNVLCQDWDGLRSVSRSIKFHLLVKFILTHPYQAVSEMVKLVFYNIRKVIKPSGICIAFVGTDGSGKSTMIKQLMPIISKVQVKENSRILYWRPFILPKISHVLPIKTRKITPKNEVSFIKKVPKFNKIASGLKFSYYLIDYMLGGIIVKFLVARGGIVLYDRHYDDLLVYPERFGMTLPKCLVRLCRVILPQPDFVLYLKCSTEELTKRKREIFDEELKRQVTEYSHLESSLNNFHSINAEAPIQDVVLNVKKIVFDALKKNAKKSLKLLG